MSEAEVNWNEKWDKFFDLILDDDQFRLAITEQQRLTHLDPRSENNSGGEEHGEEAVVQPDRVALDREDRVRPRRASGNHEAPSERP